MVAPSLMDPDSTRITTTYTAAACHVLPTSVAALVVVIVWIVVAVAAVHSSWPVRRGGRARV